MDETIIVPSPNWFQVSGLAVAKDGWLIYGGPSKSLCILVPIPKEYDSVIVGSQKYHAHVVNRAHMEKIVSVDICPGWPEKRSVLTGSADGSVKQWNLEQLQLCHKMKPSHSHEVHSREKEEIAGVGYSNELYAITVGCFGNIVKWNLNSNVVNNFNHLRNFKPVCMSCSPHIPLNVAVGTKQGVVFVLDLNGPGKIIYKVRGQDDEIANLSWCPQYEVSLKKVLKESERRASLTNTNEVDGVVKNNEEELDASGCGKKLPEDSFDESLVVVPEDDMFDIYKDHEADEFGHKKYQPEEILVKVHSGSNEQDDYLSECLKLKEVIIKRKTQADASIQSLVDTLDKTHVDSSKVENLPGSTTNCSESETQDLNEDTEASEHIHKHLLATISKYGGVRIWSKTGKLIGSCAVSNTSNKQSKAKLPFWPTLLWYKSDVLLLADGKNNLLGCNPIKLDCKNKLDWNVVHALHKRGIYSITSNAPRVQSGTEANDDWHVWTTSQERIIVQYSLNKREKVAIHPTCGGFIYTVLPCPYDAGKVAISAGDGAIRIWNASITGEDDAKLQDNQVTCYWQNVLGKVLVAAWHPTKENLLAFATAESRVGLIDTSGRTERPAKALVPALRGPVYSISWGERNELYACAAGELVVYDTDNLYDPPRQVKVVVECQAREVSCVRWSPRALLCGTNAGAVAALTHYTPHALLAATHVYNKMIYMVEWHPQQTSSSSEESPFKNLIAVCSMDKQNTIVILDYIEKEDGSKHLQTWKTLSGHRLPVFQVNWNPHRDGQLLSTSQDCTVRVWDASSGECTSIFAGHGASSLCGAWIAFPALAGAALSGGSDCCLRLWAAPQHAAGLYDANLHDVAPKKDKKKNKKNKEKKAKKEEAADKEEEEAVTDEGNETEAASEASKVKAPKKFLLPTIFKQTACHCKIPGVKLMLQKYLEKTSADKSGDFKANVEGEFDLDFIKMFGTINEVNELLDNEMNRHEERGNTEAWALLCMFRGQVDKMIQFASQRDLLCPFLLSLAPCVSFKYWKDATQLYVAQIDRLVAKGEAEKLYEDRKYGGPIYRKVATLLSIHDVKSALAVLVEADLYKEAYILCRTRYMDSIAEQTLQQWASYCVKTGTFVMAAVCYIALGELSQAAASLGKLNDQDSLKLAADIAKIIGHNIFAEHVIEKREIIKNSIDIVDKTEEILKELPSRMEALLSNGDKKQNGETYSNGTTVLNGSGDAKE
ncbi:unnamed protein product [Chilo suppressalis]|uniref:Gem-associated protein 5 n=1 Tax=Chilo suppressalis TaxID=168631 RepID=A0ABN8AUF4_CHISP|nr:unnamed protein product [Chilo suppressalis]